MWLKITFWNGQKFVQASLSLKGLDIQVIMGLGQKQYDCD